MTADGLLELLKASGIPFAKDIWVDPTGQMECGEYGVLEVTGSPRAIWGNNRIVYQSIQGSIYLYTTGGGDTDAKSINTILAANDVCFRLVSSEFLEDTNQTRWTWQFELEVF